MCRGCHLKGSFVPPHASTSRSIATAGAPVVTVVVIVTVMILATNHRRNRSTTSNNCTVTYTKAVVAVRGAVMAAVVTGVAGVRAAQCSNRSRSNKTAGVIVALAMTTADFSVCY